jgi:hypothetical protein
LIPKNPQEFRRTSGEPGRAVLFPASASGTALNPAIRVKYGVSA